MLKNIPWLIPIIILVFLRCGDKSDRDLAPVSTGPGGVTVGMTRSEVQEIMLGEVQKLQMVGQVKNPYATEFRRGQEGQVYEVMFYYAELKTGDNQVSDDELMPVVLLDGKVVGWGWGFLNQVTSNQKSERTKNRN